MAKNYDTMYKGKGNWHNGVHYDEHTMHDLERILVNLYTQKNPAGYRKYNIIETELNIPDVRLTNDDNENIRRIHNGNKQLKRVFNKYINDPQIRDWGYYRDRNGQTHKYNGAFAGAIPNLERTFITKKNGEIFYHPHLHLDLITYGSYYNTNSRFYHNPSFVTLNNKWHRCIKQQHWDPKIYSFGDHDMCFITRGYLKLPNRPDLKMKKLTNNPYRDRLHPYKGCFIRFEPKQRPLEQNDGMKAVQNISYNESKEFTKYFDSEQQYNRDLKNGKRDVDFIHDKGLYAFDKATNFGKSYNNLGYYGVANKLYNHMIHGDYNRTPIVKYNHHTGKTYISNPKASYSIQDVYQNLPFQSPFKSINNYVESSHDQTHFGQSVNNTMGSNNMMTTKPFNTKNHQSKDQQRLTKIRLLKLKRRRGLSRS